MDRERRAEVEAVDASSFGRDGLKSLISSKKQGGFLEKIVLEDELTERLQWTTNSLVNAKKNGTPYRHLLLHGPPGTGKTLFARTLARQSGQEPVNKSITTSPKQSLGLRLLSALPRGLDYAIMSGGDVGPLGKDAVRQPRSDTHAPFVKTKPRLLKSASAQDVSRKLTPRALQP
ncbi:ATAD3B [Symbiodinium sp. CCMP2456]|nr:ATAD3B [Symbiodinium sp. CCMP2456]